MGLPIARSAQALCIGLFAVSFSLSAYAEVVPPPSVSITDLNSFDANSIIGQDFANSVLRVVEGYNEKYTVPYASHDGQAVVNVNEGYFDKVVTYSNVTGPVTFSFKVTNTTPWSWSDYHVEFWNSSFTQRLKADPTSLTSDVFRNSAVITFNGGTIVEFWAPNWQEVGATGVHGFTLNLTGSGIAGGEFGIRQVATVPEPESYAMLLAGLGLLSFIAGRKRMKF